MRIGLYVGCVIGEAKTSNTLVLSVAINRCVTPGKCSDIWIAEHTVSALKKNMASVGCWIGSRHWYPLFSNKNQIPNPQVDASMWIVSIEWPLATPQIWRKIIQVIAGHVQQTMPVHAEPFCWFLSSPTSESSQPADLPASTILIVFLSCLRWIHEWNWCVVPTFPC